MATSVFSFYDKEAYFAWHKEFVDNESDLELKIEAFRTELKEGSTIELDSLAQLLTQIKSRTEPECKLQSGGLLTGEFILPLNHISQNSDALYKSTDSIIEKLWRKNSTKSECYVGLSNLNAEITDLVRTSVICPTLQHAKMYLRQKC